jgi:hypothetical protein
MKQSCAGTNGITKRRERRLKVERLDHPAVAVRNAKLADVEAVFTRREREWTIRDARLIEKGK